MNETIHRREYVVLVSFLMRATFLGWTVFTVLQTAKQDGWISMILSFILSFLPLFLYYKVLNIDPSQNMIGLVQKYIGKIGIIINIAIIGFLLFQASTILWDLTDFISSQYLYQTPLLIISIIFMIGVFYTAKKGLTTIGRVGIVLFIINIILFSLAFFSLASKIQLSELKPMFEFGMLPIFKGSLFSLSYNVLPLFVLLMIPKNNIEDHKKLTSSFLKIYFYTFVTIFLVIFVCITIFGIDLATLYQYPEYHVLKTINIANFFQRVESILSLQWIFDSVMALIIYLYSIKNAIVQTFSIRKGHSILLPLLAISLIVISKYLFISNTVAENFALALYPILSSIFLFGLPLFILVVTIIRKKA